MKGRLRLFSCAALALSVLLAAGADADDPSSFEDKLARYRSFEERPSLYMRHRGRREFAESGDLRALRILTKSYAHPEVPKDQVQYLLASLCADHFRAPPHLATLRAWRRKHAKTEDAWLWYRVLEAELHIDGSPELVAAVRTQRDGVLRAAALEALIAGGDEAVLPLALELLAALPAKPLDRTVVLRTLAGALYATRTKRKSGPWRALAAGLLPWLEQRSLPEATKLVIARRLQAALGTRKLHRAAAAWPAVLDGKAPTDSAGDGTRYAPPSRPTFLGIEATGPRVVYVIDMSDSMLTPLTGKEIEDLKRTPARAPAPAPVITGGNGAQVKPKRKPGDKPPAPDPRVLKLPWPFIKTRFDAAREFLKLSLRALAPQQSFCVIGFGSEAQLLDATPGLRRAERKNVEKACVELDVIEPGRRTKARPYGTLRGYTNIHGGLHRAFKLRAKGLVKKREYVNFATFEDGCDTIFLLSDGKPTWDDWPEWDTRLPEHKSGDPESGAQVQDHEKGHYYGPYALSSVLRDDVRRLNLFRKVEIHCVGIGEYDPYLLQWISRNGLGRFRRIGGT